MPAGARCAVLVTSRSEYGAPGGRTVRVRELATPDAVRLLANLVGHRRVDAEREAAVDIVRLAGNLPLAVRAAAARLAAVPDWSLERFARLLSEPATRLRELRADDLDLQARYDACYERLDEREKWTFRLLALTGGRPFRPPDVAELLGCPPLVVEIVLARLVECHLLELVADPARGPARYAFSGLARCYAMERLAGVVVPGADALMAGGRAPG